MDGCDFCGKEDLLGYECYVVCKECSDKYTNRASEENNKSAVALLQQAKDAYTHGNFAQWVGEHGKEINAVIAQSPLLPNNGINSDSPRLRTGNPSPEGFAGYETDEPQ